MRQLLYNSIKNRKMSTILILINLVISVIIVYDLLHLFDINKLEEDIINKYINLNGSIMLEYTDFTKDPKDVENDLVKIKSFIKDKDIKYGGYVYTNYQFSELESNSKYISVNEKKWVNDPLKFKPMASKLLYVDEDIVNMIPDKSGQIKKLYAQKSDEIPIVVGTLYKDIFYVGQELTDKENVKYKIIGFLDKDTRWITSKAFYKSLPINLEEYFVIPYNKSNKFNTFAITGIAKNFIIESKDYKESKMIVDDLKEYANKNNLNMNPISTYAFIQDERELRYDNIRYMSAIAIVVIIFIIIISTLSMMSSIEKRKYDIAIMITQGASNKFLALYVLIENLSIFLLALIIGFAINFFWKSNEVIFLYKYSTFNLNSVMIVSGILLITCIIATLIPMKKITSINPSKLIVE